MNLLVDIIKKVLPINSIRQCENIWRTIFNGCMGISFTAPPPSVSLFYFQKPRAKHIAREGNLKH